MDVVVERAAGTVAGIVGREPELEVLRGFVGADGSGRALVLSGEAGIGKTTLWEAGVELARERGLRALVARPSGTEARLSFAALIDVFEGVGSVAREQVADPIAGDDINDRVRDPLAPREVCRVPNPDPVLFPGNLWKYVAFRVVDGTARRAA